MYSNNKLAEKLSSKPSHLQWSQTNNSKIPRNKPNQRGEKLQNPTTQEKEIEEDTKWWASPMFMDQQN